LVSDDMGHRKYGDLDASDRPRWRAALG